MHAICTLRFNAAIGQEAPYYRLKESYRDVRGNVHSLVLLNVGFEPPLTPRQVHRIADFLSDRFANRHTPSLFKERTDDLTDIEYAWAEKFWQCMVNEGHIDRFDRKEGKAREEAGRYVDLDTMEHTNACNVGAEWLCKQAIDRLGLSEFLRHKGWKEDAIHADYCEHGKESLSHSDLIFMQSVFKCNPLYDTLLHTKERLIVLLPSVLECNCSANVLLFRGFANEKSI